MAMTEMHVGGQTIRYDREATGAIYASLKGGWAEGCLCVGCRNLMAQRDVVYPPAFRELLDRLGIDPNKEGEAVAYGPLENGLHQYEGWFFFVGEMVTSGEDALVSNSPYFGYFFTRGGPRPKEFGGGPHLGVEFAAHLKWILMSAGIPIRGLVSRQTRHETQHSWDHRAGEEQFQEKSAASRVL
jgi:hypothetical protein